MEKQVGVGIAVILMNSDKVLLGKRKGSHGAGSYGPPGGHLEYMEGFAGCAKRELKEETGLGEENVILFDYAPVAATNDFFSENNKHYVTLFLRMLYLRGEPRIMEPEKCEGWNWYYWENMPSPLFTPVKNLKEQGYDPFRKFKLQGYDLFKK